MLWPGLTNLFMGHPHPRPESPYLTYVRKRTVENRELHRRGTQPSPLMGHEEWSQKNEQAIADWQEQLVQRHNQDHKTSYRNWNDFSRAMRDSVTRDQDIEANLRRTRNQQGETHSFVGRPGQRRNVLGETDEEWFARTMVPHRVRGMGSTSDRDFHGGNCENTGRARGEGFSMRDGFPEESIPGTAAWRDETGRQNVGTCGPAVTGGRSSEEDGGRDEAQAFLNSFGRAETPVSESGEWSDEAEAFLNSCERVGTPRGERAQ